MSNGAEGAAAMQFFGTFLELPGNTLGEGKQHDNKQFDPHRWKFFLNIFPGNKTFLNFHTSNAGTKLNV